VEDADQVDAVLLWQIEDEVLSNPFTGTITVHRYDAERWFRSLDSKEKE
jgi:hypothetical protein